MVKGYIVNYYRIYIINDYEVKRGLEDGFDISKIKCIKFNCDKTKLKISLIIYGFISINQCLSKS